jgi:hypothetical protein
MAQGRTTTERDAVDRSPIGDWLAVPPPTTHHLWRWGRINQILRENGRTYYRVRWLGDLHDSVVLPPPDARIESATPWPSPGGDANGVWPA